MLEYPGATTFEQACPAYRAIKRWTRDGAVQDAIFHDLAGGISVDDFVGSNERPRFEVAKCFSKAASYALFHRGVTSFQPYKETSRLDEMVIGDPEKMYYCDASGVTHNLVVNAHNFDMDTADSSQVNNRLRRHLYMHASDSARALARYYFPLDYLLANQWSNRAEQAANKAISLAGATVGESGSITDPVDYYFATINLAKDQFILARRLAETDNTLHLRDNIVMGINNIAAAFAARVKYLDAISYEIVQDSYDDEARERLRNAATFLGDLLVNEGRLLSWVMIQAADKQASADMDQNKNPDEVKLEYIPTVIAVGKLIICLESIFGLHTNLNDESVDQSETTRDNIYEWIDGLTNIVQTRVHYSSISLSPEMRFQSRSEIENFLIHMRNTVRQSTRNRQFELYRCQSYLKNIWPRSTISNESQSGKKRRRDK